MYQDIRTDLHETFGKLMDTLSSLSEDQLNKSPYTGSWTAAQVGDHLSRSYGIIELLDGNTTPSSQPVSEKVQEIKALFLNFEIQMESPAFILPSEGWIAKEQLLLDLEQKTHGILDSMNSRDLSVSCLDFELPGSGILMGWEWIHFINYHTQRHLYQLDKIRTKLA